MSQKMIIIIIFLVALLGASFSNAYMKDRIIKQEAQLESYSQQLRACNRTKDSIQTWYNIFTIMTPRVN